MKKKLLFFITLNIFSCTAFSASQSKQSKKKEAINATKPEIDEFTSNSNTENTRPFFSTEEIEKITSVQHFKDQFEQTEMAEKKIAELHKKLKESREAGWDTLTPEDEIPSTKPVPPAATVLTQLTEIPQHLWEKYVTNPNRIEHFLRFSGMKTYLILLQKLKENEFTLFIKDLNTNNAEEGNRWIDEALNQAIEDNREETTRKMMAAANPYKRALPITTRQKVVAFLTLCADKKRKSLAADLEDYATDIATLANIIQEADIDNPKQPIISKEDLERSSHQAALTLTQQATAGYLPRPATDKKL